MKLLPQVASWFVRLKDRKTGATAAEVTTVAPVPERERPSWSAALGRMAGTPVRVEFRTDPTLIGGAVARVGSVLYDGSVRGSLEKIRQSLLGE
jgi:F-type H+-transporting ATPase subunit delta